MKTKRIISLLASLAMMVTAVTGAMTVSVVSAADEYASSGTWGSNGKWVLSEDGTLAVTGTGELMYDALTPKLKFVQDVKRLVVGEGITKIVNGFSGEDLSHYNLNEMVLPSTLKDISAFSLRGEAIKDVYIYSKNITIDKGNSGMLPRPGGGVVMHLYKDSNTEKCFRSIFDYTDEDIVYIEGDRPEEPEPIPADVPKLTETSGPCGLTTKWEWDKTSKTLTFSGKGVISIADCYKQYAEETEHIVIESGITKIFASTGVYIDESISGTFYGFSALQDVELPDTLTFIGELSFYGDPLTSINLPEGLIEIDDAAFKNCSNLEDISFPESLNKIGDSAFQYCSKLKSINLHEGMTIGGRAFNGCESLKELTIPKNVRFLRSVYDAQGMSREPATFMACTGLEKIVIEDGCWLGDPFNNEFTKNGIADHFCLQCYSLNTVVIKGDVDCIRPSAFGSCTSLTDIYLYNTGLTTITAKGTSNLEGGADPNEPDLWRDSFWTGNNPTFHVIKGSTTEQTLIDAGYLNDENTVYLPDTTALETAISEAEAIETDKYTDESVSAFTETLENAKALLDNMNATQDEVDSAVKAINDAKNALEEKKDEPSKPSESDPSTPSDSSDPTTPTKPTSPTSPTGGNVKKTTSPAQKASEAKAAAEKAIKQAKIVSLTAKAKGKKKITVSWKKVAKAAGYEVQASTKKNFKKNVVNKATTKNKVVFKKLKSKKKYFVRVRAYTTYKDAKGKTQKVYGKWFKSKKKVKVK